MKETAVSKTNVLTHRIVWLTAIFTTAPILGMIAYLFLSGVLSDAILWLIPFVTFLVGMGFGVIVYNTSYRQLDRIINAYSDMLERVSAGDLTQRLDLPEAKRSHENAVLAHLGEMINRTIEKFQTVVQDFDKAMNRLESDTQAILDATSRQISMANEQDAVVTETTATVNEVRATVTETAERAQSVADTAQISVEISLKGSNAVTETVKGMEMIRRRVEDIADNILVLSEHTQQIGEIIAAVNNLADQSRMLALNASVEAARAGEEGKGFAVVAMEVRNLADQNRDATVQVREILGEIQRATNSAVMVTEEGSKGVDAGQNLVNSAGDSINNLAKAIEEAALAAMQIAASTRQQTIGMDQLTNAMRTIKHATTETVSSTMQVEASVQRLRDAAGHVNRALSDLSY